MQARAQRQMEPHAPSTDPLRRRNGNRIKQASTQQGVNCDAGVCSFPSILPTLCLRQCSPEHIFVRQGRKFPFFAAQAFSRRAVQRRAWCTRATQLMKFLFLLWMAIRSIFDAAVWATAGWCILYSFTNVLWWQCFGIFLAIHFLWNWSFVKYVSTHTKRDCFFYTRSESISVGCAIIHALILSIIPTVVAIILLSLLEVWTNLETHWLHTWLFVACLVYILSRAGGKRRMARPPAVVQESVYDDLLQSRSNPINGSPSFAGPTLTTAGRGRVRRSSSVCGRRTHPGAGRTPECIDI
jgi:hypothetical protein